MVLFPGQWHTYYPYVQTGWNEYYIGFEGAVIDDMVKGGFLSKENQVLEVGLNEELVSLFSRALEIAEADKISSQQYLAGIVLHMIGMILSISKNKIFEVGDVDQKIEQAKIIMNENVFKDVDPEELAMKLNISYSWFRKVFKDYTGYAPAKYFQELKLRKAKQLLVGTSLSVKEISFMLDYKSTEHFFSSFKKRTGFTPLEYRGSVRKAGCNPCSRFQYYAHNLDSLNKKNGMSATPLNWLLKAFTLALNDSAPALVCLFTKKLSMVS